MPPQTKWARFAVAGVALSASIAACDSVLDIQDPNLRPAEAGAGGEPTTSTTDSGGSSSGSGGSGGTHGNSTPIGGAAAGDATTTPGGGAGAGGEGGEPMLNECEPQARKCGGANAKIPQICDETGHWSANTLEAVGDCPLQCSAGKCTQCVDNDRQCRVCANDDALCNSNQPQTCVAGEWTDEGAACSNYCALGECKTPTSCGSGLEVLNTCQAGESCCLSKLVPGGTFFRDFDGADFPYQIYPAQISPFALDKFEVTVGRMRPFVAAFEALALSDGAGKSGHIPDDHGWNTAYKLPVSQAALLTQLQDTGCTWSDSSADNQLPINCVPFNVAYAFCIWDGGRLPTEAEWNFAAAGGDQQRVYPWPDPELLDTTYANYGTSGPVNVGSSPLGNGRWGQSDLAGNVAEWVLDYHQDYPATCNDCLTTTASTDRVERGGSYYESIPFFLSVSYRSYVDSLDTATTRGFRCARDLE